MGKVVWITGAARGIGRGSAERLLEEGFRVYGGDIEYDAMADLEARGMRRLRVDVTRDEDVDAAVAKIMEAEGRIDGLVANAGYMCLGMIECVSIEEAKRNFEVNLWGMARCTLAVLPHMRAAAPEGRGRIVFMSSGAGKVPAPGMAWYPATKHALEAFADGLRMEMKATFPGIQVSMIEPGWVRTHLLEASLPTWEEASRSENADTYRRQLDDFKANVSAGFADGAAVETISEVVYEALTTERPKQRYMPNLSARAGIYAERFLEGTTLLDDKLIDVFLGSPE